MVTIKLNDNLNSINLWPRVYEGGFLHFFHIFSYSLSL